MSEIYLKKRQFDSALVSAREAIGVAPDQRQGYFQLASAFVLGGKPDSAIATYKRLNDIDENPFTEVAAARQIASVNRAWGRFEAAQRGYAEAGGIAREAGMNDQVAATDRTEAWMLLYTGRLNEAVKRFQRAVDLDTLNQGNAISLAQALAEAGEVGKAREVVASMQRDWAGRLDTSLMKSVEYAVEARAAMINNDSESAIRFLMQERKASGDSTESRLELAQAYIKAGRYNDAITELRAKREEGETSWPSDSYIHSLYYLADALVKAGRKEEALEPLQRFLVFWGDADWDVPVVRDAKQLYGALAAQ